MQELLGADESTICPLEGLEYSSIAIAIYSSSQVRVCVWAAAAAFAADCWCCAWRADWCCLLLPACPPPAGSQQPEVNAQRDYELPHTVNSAHRPKDDQIRKRSRWCLGAQINKYTTVLASTMVVYCNTTTTRGVKPRNSQLAARAARQGGRPRQQEDSSSRRAQPSSREWSG